MTLRIVLGIVTVAAVIISGVYIGEYFNKSFVADALVSQIQSRDKNLSTLTDQTLKLQTDITNQTADVEKLLSSITSESSVIPSEMINPNGIIAALFGLGQHNAVSIIPLSMTAWSSVSISGVDYQVCKMSLNVSGSLDNLVQFVSQTQELYRTLVINNISLSQRLSTAGSTSTAEGDSITSPDLVTTASLSLAIYIQSLDGRS